MGFFSNLIGSPDSSAMSSPLIGRGEVLGVQMSGMTMTVGNGLTERKCTIALKVMLDGEQPYDAQCVQRIQEIYLPQLSSGSAVVAVRVDQADHSKVAIDFTVPVPTITMPRTEGHDSAAWVLANGKPITVVLVGNEPVGVKNADGIDVQALTLTVAGGVPTPYQIQVGNPVPASALPLLYPGSKLHAMLGDGPNDVVVDWSKGAVTV